MSSHNHHTGHPVMDVAVAIGGSLVAITLATMDHFVTPNLQLIDIILGWVVKGSAFIASIMTAIYIRKKIKKLNEKKH